MDFSQFKLAGTGIEERIKKEKEVPKYNLKVSPYLGVYTLIRIIDVESGNEVFRVTAKPSKEEYWIKKCKKLYRPIKHDQQRDN